MKYLETIIPPSIGASPSIVHVWLAIHHPSPQITSLNPALPLLSSHFPPFQSVDSVPPPEAFSGLLMRASTRTILIIRQQALYDLGNDIRSITTTPAKGKTPQDNTYADEHVERQFTNDVLNLVLEDPNSGVKAEAVKW